MVEKPTYEALEQRIALLENESAQRRRFEEINAALFKISNAVTMTTNLDALFRTIHLALSPVIDTTNFYIALYDGTRDSVTFPYCVDTVDACYPPVIEISRTASLTAEVIQTGRPVLVTKAEILFRRARSGFKIPDCTPSEIWLGVPLKTQDKIIGVMAVQSYLDPKCYDQTDMDVLVSVADQVALAVERKRADEALHRAHDELERRVAERTEALQESETLLQALVQTIPDLIWLKDTAGVYLYCNPMFERLYGAAKKDIIGKTDYDFVDGEHADFFREHDRKAIAAGMPIRNEEWLTFADGGYRALFDTVKTPMLDAGGKVVGVLGIAHDLTERKRAEAEKAKLEAKLQQAQKMEFIGSLAGGIAHDLNNILFPISSLSEMLLAGMPPDTPDRGSVEQIYKAAQRGSDLVKQILAISRQSKLRKLPIRIQPILKEVLKLARAAIPGNIEITSLIQADCGMVSADPTQVHQIMMNLITNAFHAVEVNGGAIHVELKAPAAGTNLASFGEKEDMRDHSMPEDLSADRYACIAVSDTGAGIEPTLINKIFEPYFTTKKQGKGTGLGLSVVHGIVKAHGGDIRVHSEVGKETVFNVYLPLLEDPKDSSTSQ
jgi:PAS domain S-box-containing protein